MISLAGCLQFASRMFSRTRSCVRAQQAETGFLVTIKVKDALNTYSPSRKNIFMLGTRYLGKWPQGHASDCKYEGNDLVARIIFGTEQYVAEFEYNFRVSLLSDVDVASSTTTCDIPERAQRVANDQYKPEDSDSPNGCFSPASSSTAFSVATHDTITYQAIQAPEILDEVVTFDKCHLIDKAMCDEVGVCTQTCLSNLVAGSPDFHIMIDGTSKDGGGSPKLLLDDPEIRTDNMLTDSQGRLRTRVDVKLVFRDSRTGVSAARRLGLKDGTKKVEGADCEFLTFVHVIEPDIFVIAVRWKARKTREAWLE